MTPAKERLKRLADKLTEDEAAVVLRVARELAGTGRSSRRRLQDLEDRADARLMREVLAEPGKIPLEEALARRGL